MTLALDLHIHSDASCDGRLTPAEIIAAARSAGLDGAAICDHDVMPDLDDVPIPDGFLLIPGVELSTDLGHILGLFLESAPEVSDRSAGAAIEAIHAAGGIAVLAHPFQRDPDEDRLLSLLGHIDGVETFNGRADRKRRDANDRAAAFAKKHGLPAFAGSDAPVAREIGNARLRVEVSERRLSAVREAVLKGGGTASGVSGQHIDVAKSQWTRLKKCGAGYGAFGKWALFAVKCAAEDLFRRQK